MTSPNSRGEAFPLTTVVAAAIIDEKRRLLAGQRAEPPSVAGFWEFPGGKVELGESEEQALLRECREELGVEIEIGARVGPVFVSDSGRFIVKVWFARIVAGIPQAFVHSQLRWLSAHEIHDVNWLPANYALINEVETCLAC